MKLLLPLTFSLALLWALPPLAWAAKPGNKPTKPGNAAVQAKVTERGKDKAKPLDPMAAKAAEVKKRFEREVTPFVAKFCVECHGDRPKAGLNLRVAVQKPGDPAFLRKWLDCATNVGANDMPPDDADQPSPAERQRFLEVVEQIKYLSPKDPGPFVIRRLTRFEYANTLVDLLGVNAAIADSLPAEVPGAGYLNSISPMQTEQYLSLASEAVKTMSAEARRRLLGQGGETVQAVASGIARLAFRRPPAEDEIQTLLKVHELGLKRGLKPQAARELMLKAALVSPQFLFITPAAIAGGNEPIVALDDHHLAARLSYLLWASMPDPTLQELADAGRLHEPEVLKAQTLRLLASPRSRALFDGFGRQWLGLGELESKTFDPVKFPQMKADLKAAMIEEARLFFESLLRENRSLVELVSADFSFLNRRLAEHYGLPAQGLGDAFERVSFKDPNRGGILALPAVLSATSFASRSSAVNRGVWVLEQVLGQRVPPAPPNVPALDQQKAPNLESMSLRQRTELHRSNAVCANCHRILDPIGFGLENFDAIGRWRDRDDNGAAIDSAGELPKGGKFSSPAQLKSLIAQRRDDLARSLTEKLLAYALGRELEGYDHLIMDGMIERLKADGLRLQTLVLEVVGSYPFLNRRVMETPARK